MALKGSNSIFFILSKKPKDFLSDNNWIKLVSNNSSIPILFKNCSFQLDVSTLDKLSSMEVIKQNKTHFVKDIFSFFVIKIKSTTIIIVKRNEFNPIPAL